MGVVPSGAYLAKKLMLGAADSTGQAWLTVVLQGGALFTAGYVVLVLVSVLRRPSEPVVMAKRVPRTSEYAALGLAAGSLLLALAALGPVSGELISNPLSPKELANTLLVFLGGVLLALGLSRRSLQAPHRDASAANGIGLRSVMVAVGVATEQADAFVRRWPSATIAMLTLAALFGWLLATR
jgi:hypothetical protein